MQDEATGARAHNAADDVTTRRGAAAWLAAGVTLAGPLLYMGLIGVPWIRETALPAFGLIAIGLAVGAWLMTTDRRWRVRIPFGISAAITAGFCFGFFALTAVPQARALADMTVAPDFTVQDQDGNMVNLGATLEDGPVLLVFYRGFW